jgi:hypothetical protein
MEIIVLAGVALAMALTVTFVLVKLFIALVALPFKIAFTLLGGVFKLALGLFLLAVVVSLALPLLVAVGLGASLILGVAALF